MSLVRDILQHRELFHVEEGDSVAAVVRRMAELSVGAIMVMGGGELRGVFSERDLMRRVVLEGRDPERTAVHEVMTTSLATIEDSATMEQAMEAMQTHGCRHLPVMRGGAVAGFLSMRDVMHHELMQKTDELHHMQAYIHGT
ncbi:MAG: CBS domain-containing protein [Bryobacteraceae bacterium]|jgi:signal-transduction protein with cAMP-binding, CBS, and nucleotidyltransferase domain